MKVLLCLFVLFPLALCGPVEDNVNMDKRRYVDAIHSHLSKYLQYHGSNTIGTTCVVDRDDTAYMVVDREFRLPTE